MNVSTRRTLGTVALAVALGALVVGPAQAADRPDDRGGTIGVGATTPAPPSDVVERAVQRLIDARGDGTTPGALERSEVVRPDDRGGVHGPGAVAVVTPSSDRVSQDSGFDWGDVGFGAVAAVLGMIVLGGVATLTILHLYRRRVLVR